MYIAPFARYSAYKISVSDLDFSWSPKVKCVLCNPFWKADMRLYNDLLLIQTLYLVPFAIYSAFKILVSDFDLSRSTKD